MRLSSLPPYLVCFIFFLATYFGTLSEYLGDTIRYGADIVAYAQGQQDVQFWEFGHLIWRPWGYLGYLLLGNSYVQWFQDTPVQAATRLLIHINFVCSAVTLLLVLYLLRKYVNGWLALAVVIAMNCSVAFLNYSHSGAPYIPALLFSILTFLLLIQSLEQPEMGRRYSLLAGVTFMIACALWFPYAFSGLGMLAILYFHPARAPRLPLAVGFLGSLAVVGLVLFTGAAVAKGIGNTDQLMKWIQESDNGWQQTGNLKRAVTGLPRGFWNFGSDTTFLKRKLLSDPYNPSGLIQLWAFRMAAKLGLFYLGMAATLWVLWRERKSLFFVLMAAGLPLLLFAIMLFEPSSPERFFPAFPFLFMAFAVVLSTMRRHGFTATCVAVLLGSMTIFNLAEGRSVTAAATEAQRRIQALNNVVPAGALVFVVDYDDDTYRLSAQNPLNRNLTLAGFQVTDTILLAARRTPLWRETFAQRTLEQWDKNKEVWISERHLAARPESEWKWVEGDDPRVHWSELSPWFSKLEFDAKILPGEDGFLRVTPSHANREFLTAH